MKNMKTTATLIMVSGLLASTSAFAGGSKSGGDPIIEDPIFGETSAPAPKPILLPEPEEANQSLFDQLMQSLSF
ncbi:hypothetical protein [Alteromonas sp. a30]|uniref:hypothetical protein n=1 Tax=Alteromonas sp. a30 TaxID=2730917 RepID=UPI002282FF94|nr:hypothetical protein [Alteromonas sp. a30]MCY7294013.1 hypothetical protein [Alteromonas sp. a30]